MEHLKTYTLLHTDQAEKIDSDMFVSQGYLMMKTDMFVSQGYLRMKTDIMFVSQGYLMMKTDIMLSLIHI